jgi:hypothetical protein
MENGLPIRGLMPLKNWEHFSFPINPNSLSPVIEFEIGAPTIPYYAKHTMGTL